MDATPSTPSGPAQPAEIDDANDRWRQWVEDNADDSPLPPSSSNFLMGLSDDDDDDVSDMQGDLREDVGGEAAPGGKPGKVSGAGGRGWATGPKDNRRAKALRNLVTNPSERRQGGDGNGDGGGGGDGGVRRYSR